MYSGDSAARSNDAPVVWRNDGGATGLDYQPLPSAGITVRPLVLNEHEGGTAVAVPAADEQTMRLAIHRYEEIGSGGMNTAFRTDAQIAGKPVVLRVHRHPAIAVGEAREAALAMQVHDQYQHDREQAPVLPHERMAVIPMRVYGQVTVPVVVGGPSAIKRMDRATTRNEGVQGVASGKAMQYAGLPAIAMEEAEGVNLQTAIKLLGRRERLAFGQVVDLVEGLGQWIEQGARLQIAHTDLKTENLMVGSMAFSLIDHTPTRFEDLKRNLDAERGGAVKGTFGYTDFHGLELAARMFAQDGDDQLFGERVRKCQLRAVAMIALEVLTSEHPIADHPDVERRGYMGMCEPDACEHSLRMVAKRYNNEPPEAVATLTTFLRRCIHREVDSRSVAADLAAVRTQLTAHSQGDV